jgi:predicted transcriptional regulator
MMRLLSGVFLLSSVVSALAQQQQQPNFSPSEVAIAITSNVNGLASALENANRQIKALTDKNAELQKQIDELKPSKK